MELLAWYPDKNAAAALTSTAGNKMARAVGSARDTEGMNLNSSRRSSREINASGMPLRGGWSWGIT